MKKSVWRVLHAAACSTLLLGQTICAASDDVTITPTGIAAMEVGQVKHGYFKFGTDNVNTIEHVWQQNARVFFGYKVMVKNALELNFVGGGRIDFSTPQIAMEPVTMQTHHFFYIDRACAAYPVGDPEHWYFKFQIGYFPYKYNPDVRNLGEYLFRTMAYPLVVYSEFDKPWTHMLGARVNFQFADKLIENDLLLHSEIVSVPVQDWSVSDIVSSTVAGLVSVGAGVSFSHYLSVYQGRYPISWADPNYYPQNLNPNAKKWYLVGSNGDSACLGWESLRGMARFSIDPKPILPFDIFGPNDLKLYGEIDVIGFKNYPYREGDVGYDSLKERIFYTAGFNLPGLKLLDLVNVEAEYCANRSAFSDGNLYGSNTPSLKPVSMSQYGFTRSRWRWSVYLKKSFFDDHFSVIAQVARDHKKVDFYYFKKDYMSFMETLPTGQDWWWTLRTKFEF